MENTTRRYKGHIVMETQAQLGLSRKMDVGRLTLGLVCSP